MIGLFIEEYTIFQIIFLSIVLFIQTAAFQALAKVPPEKILAEIDKILSPLQTENGRLIFFKDHPGLCGKVDKTNLKGFVSVEPQVLKIDKEVLNFGLSCRAIYIEAPPSKVISTIDNPLFFQSLYGLNKTAELGPKSKDGIYEARVFKLVPGVETQDYILKYTPHQEKLIWFERATQIKDDAGFALRDNFKIVEPSGTGTLHREISIFVPQRWWLKMKIIGDFVHKVTLEELTKINVALKCAAENIEPLSEAIAKKCHQEAEK